MSERPLNIVQICDHLGWPGSRMHGVKRLFAWMIPRFDRSRFHVSLISLRQPDTSEDTLESHGVDVTYLDRSKFDPRTLRALLRELDRRQADILHMHGYGATTFGRLAAARRGLPTLLQEHANLTDTPWFQKVADRLLVPYTDLAIAVSRSTADFVINARLVPETRTRVVYLGAPLEEFGRKRSEEERRASRRALGLPSDGFVVGTITRLMPSKGNRYLVDAARQILDRGLDAHFCIVGEGELQTELEAQTRPKVLEEAPGKSWEQELRRLSALFKNFPRILRSSVELNVYQGNNYFLNSEGSRNRLPERVVGLRAAAALQAKDGSPLRNEMLILVRSLDELPEAAALEEKVMSTATELIQLAEAPLAEDYSGPVLFTSDAAARLLAVLLAPHLSGTRPPERPEGGIRFRGLSRSSAWGSRWKARVLPAFFDVTDDPTKETFNGSHLMGSFPVDREGVRAEPVRLVESGRLVNFLMSRSPRREISRSNGHGRALGSAGVVHAKPGNLFVTATEGVVFSKLKARLIEEAIAQEKPFAILVRKVGPVVPAGGRSFDAAMETAGGALGGAFSGLPEGPVLAYRVWVKDGREELVRGLQFSSMNPRSLRDILSAGNESAVYNHLAVASSLSGVDLLPTSIIAPALLFDDLELRATRGQKRKLPVLPPPFGDGR